MNGPLLENTDCSLYVFNGGAFQTVGNWADCGSAGFGFSIGIAPIPGYAVVRQVPPTSRTSGASVRQSNIGPWFMRTIRAGNRRYRKAIPGAAQSGPELLGDRSARISSRFHDLAPHRACPSYAATIRRGSLARSCSKLRAGKGSA